MSTEGQAVFILACFAKLDLVMTHVILGFYMMTRLLIFLVGLAFVRVSVAESRFYANGLLTNDPSWSLLQTVPFSKSIQKRMIEAGVDPGQYCQQTTRKNYPSDTGVVFIQFAAQPCLEGKLIPTYSFELSLRVFTDASINEQMVGMSLSNGYDAGTASVKPVAFPNLATDLIEIRSLCDMAHEACSVDYLPGAIEFTSAN